MSDFKIDFEWPAAKYDFRPASPKEIQEKLGGRSFARESWLATFPDEPEENAPDWDAIPEEELPQQLGYLVRKSRAVPRRPAEKAMKMAVKLLVEGEKTPLHIKALKIAQALGGLTEHKEEQVEDWGYLARVLRLVFAGKEIEDDGFDPLPRYKHPDLQRVGAVGIYLVRKAGKPELALRPDNLFNALVLYAARMASTGTKFHTCEYCNAPFLGGGAGRGRNKKRSDARFCSDKCRWDYNNARRKRT